MKSKHSLLQRSNVILQQLKRDMDALDTWLNFRERALHESDVGNSIDIIEEQLRKHEDFEQMVLAQETKFGDINRLTLVSPSLPV